MKSGYQCFHFQRVLEVMQVLSSGSSTWPKSSSCSRYGFHWFTSQIVTSAQPMHFGYTIFRRSLRWWCSMMFLSKLMNVVSLMMNHIPVIGLSRYTRFNWTGVFPRHGILRYSSDNPKGASHIPIIFIYIYYSIPDYSSSHVLLYIITHRIHVFTINIPHLC